MPTFSQLLNIEEQEEAARQGALRRAATRRAMERGRLLALRRAFEADAEAQRALDTAQINREAERRRRDFLRQLEEDRRRILGDRLPPAPGEVIGWRARLSPGQMFEFEGVRGGVFTTPTGTQRLVLRGRPQTKDEMEAILERRGGLAQIEAQRRKALGLRPFEELSPENRALWNQYQDMRLKKALEAREAGLVAGGATPEEAARQVRAEYNQLRGLPEPLESLAARARKEAEQETAALTAKKEESELERQLRDLQLRSKRAEVGRAEAALAYELGRPEREEREREEQRLERQQRMELDKARLDLARQEMQQQHEDRMARLKFDIDQAKTREEREAAEAALKAEQFAHEVEMDQARMSLAERRIQPHQALFNAKVELYDIRRAAADLERQFNEASAIGDTEKMDSIESKIVELADMEQRLENIIREAEEHIEKFGKAEDTFFKQLVETIRSEAEAEGR